MHAITDRELLQYGYGGEHYIDTIPKPDGPYAIGFDINGPFIDKQAVKAAIVNKELGLEILPENCRGSYIRNNHPHLQERYRRITEHLIFHPDFIKLAEPIPGSLETIDYFWKCGRLSYGVSSESSDALGIYTLWFEHWHKCPMPFLELKLTDHQTKDPFCQEHNIGVYIDDEIPKLNKLVHVPLKYHFKPKGKPLHRLGIQTITGWYDENGVLVAPQIQAQLESLEMFLGI